MQKSGDYCFCFFIEHSPSYVSVTYICMLSKTEEEKKSFINQDIGWFLPVPLIINR
jgi:hypothetical protein